MTSIRAWVSERLPAAVFAPAIAVLTLAVMWATSLRSVRSLLVAALLVGVLVVQFRLWDDLEDAGTDRQTHPDRSLPNVSTTPFVVLLAVLSALSLGVAARRGAAAMALVALNLWMLLGYRAVRRQVSDTVWRYSILLAKYPAVVAIAGLTAGSESTGRLGAAAGAAYVCAGAYEWIHHDRLVSRSPS